MNLVLNTIGASVDNDMIRSLIPDKKEVEIINTSDMKIAHCMGCNQCWLKTPGICAIKDDYESILKKLVQADNLWLVSNTRFGFLDHKSKRMMDRIMPMLNMTIGFRDGWMRHELRYHALNIGLLFKGNAEQTMMEDWCKRTAANIGGRSLGAITLKESSEKTQHYQLSTINYQLSTINYQLSTLNSPIWSSSTAARVWRNSATQTRLSIRLPKGWKKLVSLGSCIIFPTEMNGMRRVRLI